MSEDTEIKHKSEIVNEKTSSVTAQFYGFTGANSVFGFTGTGQLVIDRLSDFEEARQVGEDLISGYQGGRQLKIELGDLGPVVLPRGITIVSGATEVGKSSFLRALREASGLERLQVVEPYDSDTDLTKVRAFENPNAALVHLVRDTLTRAKKAPVYAIDSLRAPLFETKGAATSKGVIGQFFTQVTRVSNSLARSRITTIASVNPMDEDPAYVASFLRKLSASTVSVILLTSTERSGELTRYKGTIAMRPDRTPRPFTVDFRVGMSSLAQKASLSVDMSSTTSEDVPNTLAVRNSINAFSHSI